MSLTKNVSLTFGTKIISIVLSFGISVFFTRLLGAEGKGMYGFLMANVGLFTMLLGFGVPQTITYFIANKEYKNSAVVGMGIYMAIAGIIVFTGMSVLLFITESAIINFLVPKSYVSSTILLFLVFSFANTSILNFFNGIWQGKMKFKDMNLALLVGNLIRLLTLAGVWVYIEKSGESISVENVLVLSIGISILELIIKTAIFFQAKTKAYFGTKYFKSLGKTMVKFGTTGMTIGVLHFANKRLDIWFVEAYSGLEQLGIYLLAAGLIDMVMTTVVSVTQVLVPYYVEKTEGERINLLVRVSRINTVLAFLLVLLVAIFGSFLIPLLYGEEFTESVYPFCLLCLGGFFLMIQFVFASYNVATDQQKVNVNGSIIALIITLVLDIFLIPKYGILGACYASVIAYMSSCISIVYPTVKKKGKSFSEYFIVKTSDLIFMYNTIKNQISKNKV